MRAALCRSHGAQKAAHLDADGLVGGPCPSSSASACEIMCAVFATWSVSIALLFGRGEVKGSGERTHRSGRSAPGRSNAGGGPTGFRRAFGTKATVSIFTVRCCTVLRIMQEFFFGRFFGGACSEHAPRIRY